jgi:hypothetical protein
MRQNKLPSWKQCLRQKLIRTSAPDKVSMLQMERMAQLREEFLQKHFENKFLSLKVEAYYDIIRELLHAHMYKNGFSCIHDLLLLVYARHHFHVFRKEMKFIEELFRVRSILHKQHPEKLKKYLANNEEKLQHVIGALKKRLQE